MQPSGRQPFRQTAALCRRVAAAPPPSSEEGRGGSGARWGESHLRQEKKGAPPFESSRRTAADGTSSAWRSPRSAATRRGRLAHAGGLNPSQEPQPRRRQPAGAPRRPHRLQPRSRIRTCRQGGQAGFRRAQKAQAPERPRSPKAWRQRQAAQERKRAGSAPDAGGSDARSKDSAPIEREELRSPGLFEKPLASAASSRPLLHSAAAGRTPLFRKSASRWQGARSPEAAALRGAVSGWRTNS